MQISLNEQVSILSDRVGQPFNKALQEELKVILNYKRADFFRKLLQRNPADAKYFRKDFTVGLIEVNQTDVCTTKVLETKLEIPLPVRTGSGLYDYVGAVDMSSSFTYCSPDQLEFIKFSRYTGKRPRYYRSNNKLRILNEKVISNIGIAGVFSDPRVLIPFTTQTGSLCYTDDDPYEIPEDIVNAIMIDTLSKELRTQFPETDEIETDEDSRT